LINELYGGLECSKQNHSLEEKSRKSIASKHIRIEGKLNQVRKDKNQSHANEKVQKLWNTTGGRIKIKNSV